MPTKIGLHAFHVTLNLHEIFEPILFFELKLKLKTTSNLTNILDENTKTITNTNIMILTKTTLIFIPLGVPYLLVKCQ